jgi:hypothetical protein
MSDIVTLLGAAAWPLAAKPGQRAPLSKRTKAEIPTGIRHASDAQIGVVQIGVVQIGVVMSASDQGSANALAPSRFADDSSRCEGGRARYG